MIAITIIAVGSLKGQWMCLACEEYEKRILKVCKLRVIEIPEYKITERPSPAQIKSALLKEAAAIRQKIPPKSFVAAMCVEGGVISSPDFAGLLEKQAGLNGQAVFIIGGSFGLCDSIKGSADIRLSLSAMTFPHKLARVMLLEQLYRASQITGGGKYHK
jgi:23S rRNA (pseudouridine1915-N3)-methyltransferase